MRNLKKVLSLALALVMLLGMMVVGAGAAIVTTDSFVDADAIQNVEAADVTVALGIIEGEKGSFMPNGTLTRAEAAVIITRLVLGPQAASLLKATNNDFVDLTGYGWAAPAIAYCSSYGIVEGDGNGHFYPGNQVTGFQFAKMLLGALGYDAEKQGYNGSGWTVYVATDARNAKLDTNLVMTSSALTRDEAVQMAFNTLNADMVIYNSVTGTLQNKPASGSDFWGTGATVKFYGEKFPSLVKTDDSTGLGRPAHTWAYGRDVIGTYEDGGVTFTFHDDCTTGGAMAGLVAQLSGYDFSKLKKANVLTNGVLEGGDPANATNASDLSTSAAAGVAELTGNGVLVEVYTNDKREVTRVVVIKTGLANVAAVNPANGSVILTLGAGDDKVGNITIEADDPFYSVVAGVKAGDKVLTVVGADNALLDASLPQTVTGNITRVVSNNKSATVGGSDYTVAKDAANFNASEINANVFTLYLDQWGYVKGHEGASVAETPNYMYLTNMWQTTENIMGVVTKVNWARGVLADGTVATLQIANAVGATQDTEVGTGFTLNGAAIKYQATSGTTSAGTAYIPALTANDGTATTLYLNTTNIAAKGQVVQYVKSSVNDTYVLIKPQSTGANYLACAAAEADGTITAPAVAAGARVITLNSTAMYMAENVNFVYVNYNSTLNTVSATALTGAQTLASNKGQFVVATDAAGRQLVTTVFVGEGYLNTTDSIYVASKVSATQVYTDGDGKVHYDGKAYTAYIDGVKTTIVTASELPAVPGCYTAGTMSGEAYTGMTNISDNVKVDTAVSGFYGKSITVGGVAIDATDAQVIDLSNNNIMTLDALTAMVTIGAGVRVSVQYATPGSDGLSAAKYIFVTGLQTDAESKTIASSDDLENLPDGVYTVAGEGSAATTAAKTVMPGSYDSAAGLRVFTFEGASGTAALYIYDASGVLAYQESATVSAGRDWFYVHLTNEVYDGETFTSIASGAQSGFQGDYAANKTTGLPAGRYTYQIVQSGAVLSAGSFTVG